MLRIEFAPWPCVMCPGDGVVRPAANRIGIDWPTRCRCRGGKPYTQYELGRILKEDPEAIVRVHELRAGGTVSFRVLEKLDVAGLLDARGTKER